MSVPFRTKWTGLVCGTLFLASGALATQQAKPRHEEAAAAGKKATVVVFPLSGKPAPGKSWQRPKGVPKVPPLSPQEKLKIVQAVHGIPAVSAPATSPFLTLYPGHLYDSAGNLELGWPEWDRLGIAHYNLAVGTSSASPSESLAKEEHALLTFKADAGNVYLVDFIVVIELPPASTAKRDFEIKVSGLPPSEEQASVGANYLTAVFYAQTSGTYTARVGLKPEGNDGVQPRWGDWYFLAVEVTKFVPAS